MSGNIGVFICHCGNNIAGEVDIEKVKEAVSSWGVKVYDYIFLCSEAGQEMIKKRIEEDGLSRVVIAACSPSHHSHVFRECIGEKLNPFLWEFVNIREQCSWVHKGEEATRKAIALIRGGVEKAKLLQPVETVKVPVNKDVLVIGGGIAGMQASLELASKGHRVYLVEKEPSIGGKMVKLDKTFPTDDCSMCTISPKLSEVAQNKNIAILTLSEIEEISGRPGEYRVKIRKKPRYVDETRCTGCGACTKSSYEKLLVPDGYELVDRIRIHSENCVNCGVCVKICNDLGFGALQKGEEHPSYDTSRCAGCFECVKRCPKGAIEIINVCPVKVPSEFDEGLGARGAIYVPFPQAVPSTHLRDPENCLRLNGRMPECRGCISVCEAGAVKDDDEERLIELTVGAIIIATGYELRDMSETEYNVEHPNVITALQLERLLSSQGPTGGRVVRPSDGKVPRSITFIQCVGSRDLRYNPYCSKICCMYALKQARLIKQEHPDIEVNICYMDLRAAGRWYEEYYKSTRELGINFIRGNVAEVIDEGEDLIVKVEDTLEGEVKELHSELVVLSVSMNPSEGTLDIAKKLGLKRGEDGFIDPLHPKIEPVDTAQEGIYIAGTCSGPKPIQESIAEANAAAGRASTFLKEDEMPVSLTTGFIDPSICILCRSCLEFCSFDAVREEDGQLRVEDVSCHSCGKCSALCPSNAMILRGLRDEQIEAQIRGILSEDPDSIIAFCCQHCSYNAADLAGLNKRKYSAKVKIIRVPCSGRVSPNHVLTAFKYGAKGVMVTGCREGECHYLDGNLSAKERVLKLKELLELCGISAERVEMYNLSSSDARKWVECVNEFVRRCS
ncbi:MAG: hydrogenase iron-sulfur subunit [Archaeoglobi archaeon]|nr:hydrogenase iron-sulfur subunit [Candidatus Mnemosynella bozhongmuii]